MRRSDAPSSVVCCAPRSQRSFSCQRCLAFSTAEGPLERTRLDCVAMRMRVDKSDLTLRLDEREHTPSSFLPRDGGEEFLSSPASSTGSGEGMESSQDEQRNNK